MKEVFIMSMESAKVFMEKMKTDEDFRKKVTECKDSEARKDLVIREGLDFTAEELKIAGDELTEDDLEGIAGSGCSLSYSWVTGETYVNG